MLSDPCRTRDFPHCPFSPDPGYKHNWSQRPNRFRATPRSTTDLINSLTCATFERSHLWASAVQRCLLLYFLTYSLGFCVELGKIWFGCNTPLSDCVGRTAFRLAGKQVPDAHQGKHSKNAPRNVNSPRSPGRPDINTKWRRLSSYKESTTVPRRHTMLAPLRRPKSELVWSLPMPTQNI